MENSLLRELQSIAGWTDEDMKQITIIGEGQGPVVHTLFKLGDAAAAVHAACGLAAAKLWELRTGRKQHVTVDIREATASLNSYLYSRYDDLFKDLKSSGMSEADKEAEKHQREILVALSAVIGNYKTRDSRWFYLHGGPKVPFVAKEILHCEMTRESFAKTIAQDWSAQDLEDAFVKNNVAGAICRSPEEWLTSEQGQILNKLGPVNIKKVANSAPIPLPVGNRPLTGINVLDCSRVLAGPTSARTMGSHGAQVLRVDVPEQGDSQMTYIDTGHGKRNTFLNIKNEGDKEKLWGLVGNTDVFSHNYRTGSTINKEFSWEKVVAQRPGIVYAHLTAFGEVGEWSGRPGYEQVAQAVTGIQLTEAKLPVAPIDPRWANLPGGIGSTYMAWHGENGVPRMLPCAFNDYFTGYLMAFGTMVALYRRATEGGSYVVNTSLAQSSMALNRMGRYDYDVANACPDMMPLSVTQRLMTDEYGEFGKVTYFGPVVSMSETPPHWDIPSASLGSSDPVWHA